MTPDERFAVKWQVNATTGCHDWTAYRDKNGYSRFRYNGAMGSGHAFSWLRANGPVPEGLELDHTCKNRGCVNPDHMELVTPAENKRRANSAQRQLNTHCGKGHEFTPENTLSRKEGRACRACRRRTE